MRVLFNNMLGNSKFANNKLVCGLGLVLILTGCGGAAVKNSMSRSSNAVGNAKNIPAQVDISARAKADFKQALNEMESGSPAKAEALLRRVSMDYPKLSGPYVNLGLIKFRQGKFDAAEKAFTKALDVNDNSAISYNHMGIISRGKGKFKQARTFYEKALDIDSNYAYAHLNFGILLDLYFGDLDQALDHYQRFQDLAAKEDREVKNWIIDIKRRIKKKNK